MAKVMVPKIDRPPSRFKPFRLPGSEEAFRCTGVFRNSKIGEYYWSGWMRQVLYSKVESGRPVVILERLP